MKTVTQVIALWLWFMVLYMYIWTLAEDALRNDGGIKMMLACAAMTTATYTIYISFKSKE